MHMVMKGVQGETESAMKHIYCLDKFGGHWINKTPSSGIHLEEQLLVMGE